MNKIEVKPLSVNRCWQGRRFKTDEYGVYEKLVIYRLPKIKVPEGKLLVRLEFGVSNKASDIDNPVKPFLDCLQKKYGFDDKRIYLLEVAKEDVKKGKEYIAFSLSPI